MTRYLVVGDPGSPNQLQDIVKLHLSFSSFAKNRLAFNEGLVIGGCPSNPRRLPFLFRRCEALASRVTARLEGHHHGPRLFEGLEGAPTPLEEVLERYRDVGGQHLQSPGRSSVLHDRQVGLARLL